jgi:hypothetical protein
VEKIHQLIDNNLSDGAVKKKEMKMEVNVEMKIEMKI